MNNLTDREPAWAVGESATETVTEKRTATFQRASGLRRLIAVVIDLSLLGASAFFIYIYHYPGTTPEFPPRHWNYFDYFVDIIKYNFDLLIPAITVFTGVYTAYFILMETIFSTSIGKFLARIKVVSSSGSRPGFIRAVVRTLLKLATTLIFFSGPLSIILSRSGRTIYDILSCCYVVKAGKTPVLRREE